MKWIKLSVGFFRSPKVLAAGRDARELYLFILLVNGERDFGGVIPAHYLDPEYLSRCLGWDRVTACNALDALHAVTLISACGEGASAITGYDEDWRPSDATVAGRVARHRENKKRNELLNTTNQDPTGECNALHSLQRVTARYVTQCNAVDQIRSDQIRVESEVPFVLPKEQKRPAKPATELAQQDLAAGSEPKRANRKAPLRALEPLKLEPEPELPRKQKRPTKAATELSHRELAAELWEIQDRLRADVMPLARTLLPIPSALALVMDRLSEGYSREDCIHVMETYADEAKKDPKQRQWFDGTTNWRPENFRRTLGRGAGDAVTPSQAPLAAYHRPMEP